MRTKQFARHLCTLVVLGFLVGSYNGRIAVWKDDDPEPFRVYPCPIYLLPHKEREALKRGIRIEDMDDVGRFIENFMS